MKKRASPESLARKEVQATLDRIPERYREPMLKQANREQSGRNYDRHLAKGAQEIFESEDKLNALRRLVLSGKPEKPLFALRPRPVNPQRRDEASLNYFFWMARRKHPEFGKRITYAVSDVNSFRVRMDGENRSRFDDALRKLMGQNGHHEKQFEIHFPQVRPYETKYPVLPQNYGARKKKRSDIPRITD
ncbi:MAG: hypothetical protein WCX64_04235 [Candidatus Micrarchaeia archaeon]|jgi:hypothetical protein